MDVKLERARWKDYALKLEAFMAECVAMASGLPMDFDEPEFRAGRYRHYKGGLYNALYLVRHHGTGLPMVVYISVEKQTLNVRPLRGWATDPDGWLDPVTISEPPEFKEQQVPRFTYVG